MKTLEAQWSSAKHLILGDDPQLRVYADVGIWFKKMELFRQGEELRMFQQQPTAQDIAVHKSLLERLIVDGEHLSLLIGQVGLPADIGGAGVGDLRSALETLRDTYRGWHEPLSTQRRIQILQEVFPDVS